MIRNFALNYPQLTRQAIRLNYPERDLLELKKAHEFAGRL